MGPSPKAKQTTINYVDRFRDYFARPTALEASAPLTDGARIRFVVGAGKSAQKFDFAKVDGKPEVEPVETNPEDPDLTFSLPPAAADKILSHESERVGEIGIEIAQLLFSEDPQLRIHLKLSSGLMGLWSRGYLGLLKVGGTEFGAFLAGKGFNGMSAIKSAIKNLRG